MNINAISPVADANYLALLPKISAANVIIEAPYGSASGFGVLECGTGTTCTAGVIQPDQWNLRVDDGGRFLSPGAPQRSPAALL